MITRCAMSIWGGRCEWAAEVQRVLKDKGSFFLNVGGAPSNPLLPHQLILVMCKLFTLQNTFHWIKSLTVETRAGEQISVGHFKPISSHRFVTDCHEYVFHLTKTGNTPVDRLAIGVPYADKSNIKRWAHTGGGDKRCRGNNWFVPYKTIRSREEQRPHPATFPVELAEQCIKLHGAESGLVVMDPFLGIGHSAVAAKNCGVAKFFGFEIDGQYLEEAREGWEGRRKKTNEVQKSEMKSAQRKNRTCRNIAYEFYWSLRSVLRLLRERTASIA